MSEIDKIIIGNIKQIGCDFDEDITSIELMSANLIVEAISKCLSVIEPSLDINVSSNLPQNMATRFKIGSRLAICVKDLGYREEVGYDTFLYANAAQVRKVFMFLIDKLPKEQPNIAKPETISALDYLKRSIALNMSKILKKPFISTKPKTMSCNRHQKFNASRLLLPQLHEHHQPCIHYYKHYLKPIWLQPQDAKDFLTSLIHTNALNNIVPYSNHSNFTEDRNFVNSFFNYYNTEKLSSRINLSSSSNNMDDVLNMTSNNDNNNTTNNIDTRIVIQSSSNFLELSSSQPSNENDSELAASIDSLKDELSTMLESIRLISSQVNNTSANIKNSEARRIELASKFDSTKEDISRRRKLLKLLPNADVNLEKLKKMSEAENDKMSSLTSQFNSLKINLEDELSDLKKQFHQQSSDSIKKRALIEEMQIEMTQLMGEAQEKENLFKQLNDLKMSKSDAGRSQYTDRILEIVENIKKQNIEIDKVLSESRSLNKEVNSLMGVLERTYLVTDELVYKDAKTDESVKMTYKLQAAMHENFSLLRKSIDDIGNVKKEKSTDCDSALIPLLCVHG